MTENLDHNIKKLLAQAPAPQPWRPEAPDAIFKQVTARLAQEQTSAAPKVRYLYWGLAAAAAVALVILGAYVLPGLSKPQTTSPDAQQLAAHNVEHPAVRILTPSGSEGLTEHLKDESTIHVASGSKVTIQTWPDQPRPLITLATGSVTCKVAKGQGRFCVQTPVGDVTALGTEFNVQLTEEKDPMKKRLAALIMTVTVLSGEVLVRDHSGLQQVAAAGETIAATQAAGPELVENWRSGQLVPKLEDGSQGKPLEVRKHNIKVTIKEQVALVEVDQTFYNPTSNRMEGTFFFPLPHGATICRLAMYVGDNLMEGEIAETQRARRTFEALKIERVDPALLEWAGGNNFKMRVFPIEPKSEKRVLISYYQVLNREFGKIRYAYPLVSDSLQTHPVGEIDLKLTVDSTPEIASARTPGYAAQVDRQAHHLRIACNAKKTTPSKDFLLEYTVAKGAEVVVTPYWHARRDEGYFLMTFAPELEAFDSDKQIGSRFVFVVDKSGGLGLRHLKLAVAATKVALHMLRQDDQFGIVAYDALTHDFKPQLVTASQENVDAACTWLDTLDALGASDLTSAWQATAALAGQQDTVVVYLGSGMSSLTSTKSARLLAAADKALADTRVRIHVLPLGNVKDMAFLSDLARKHEGTCRPLNSADDASIYVGELMDDYAWPVYRDIKVEFDSVDVGDLYPVEFPNVTAGRQFFAFGKYLAPGKAKIKVTAKCGDVTFAKEYEVEFGTDKTDTFVPKLWATRKIEHLQNVAALASAEEAGDLKRTIIETSKRFRVMSQYTSFIVLESAEDYLRYGIERRRDEFSDTDADEDLNLYPAEAPAGPGAYRRGVEKKKRAFGGRSGGGRAREPGKPGQPLPQPESNAREVLADKSGVVEQLSKKSAEQRAPDAPARPSAEAATAAPESRAAQLAQDGRPVESLRARRNAKGELAEAANRIDVLAWSRKEIFPAFGTNALGGWPHRWQHGDAKALDMLRQIATQFKALELTIATYSVNKEGKETHQGRDWVVALDAETGSYLSRRLGDDRIEVCDGKRRAQLFPLLKYAAVRQARAEDLRALGNSLPGFLLPWADRLDHDYQISIQSQTEQEVVLRLQNRHNNREYTLLHLSGSKGPIAKIEIFKQRYHNRHWESYPYQTIVCEEIKDVQGIKLPTVFRIIQHDRTDSRPLMLEIDGRKVAVNRDAARAEELLKRLAAVKGNPEAAEKLAALRKQIKGLEQAAEGVVQVIRLSDIQGNTAFEGNPFQIKIPADWAVRDLDAEPQGRDRGRISAPYNPSRNWGRRGRL